MPARNHHVSLAEPQHHVIDPTNPGSAFDDGVEDWLHVGWRAADDAEYFSRCRLMLQSLAQFRIARFEFLEQSDVFNGDDSLIGKGFEKSDLFFSKRSNFLATDRDDSYRNTLSQQRRAECGAHPG